MIKGARQLHARLDAVHDAPASVARAWASETARLARDRVQVASGATRRTIVAQRASTARATVTVGGAGKFLEDGTRPHGIEARGRVLRWGGTGQPLFRKRVRHPGTRKRPFLAPAARQALRNKSPGKAVTAAWNKAA